MREVPFALLYLSAISVAMMYVICRSEIVICSAAMAAVSCGVYFIFFALKNKKGFAALALFAMILASAALIALAQSMNLEDSFMDFIFTASSFFDPIYAAAAIVMFSVFTGFSLCYFTAYSPRLSFVLLMAFVPLILSSRTAGGIPEGILVCLMASFAACAAAMGRPEYRKYVYIDDKDCLKERIAAIFIAATVLAGALFIVPRSDSTPMGKMLDEVFTNGRGYYNASDRLTNFLTSSSVNHGSNEPSGELLFTVKTDNPRNIVRWSFDVYNGEDGWTVLDAYNTGYANWESSAQLKSSAELVRKLKNAVSDGKLEEYADLLEAVPYSVANNTRINSAEDDTSYYKANVARMYIQTADGSSTSVILHPNGAIRANIPSFSGETYRTRRDEIFSESNLTQYAAYYISYYADEPNEEFIKAVENADFVQLLHDAADEGAISDEEAMALINERSFAADYREKSYSTGMTEQIEALAAEITEGLSSDYDKALAIERWFGEAGFVYDLEFVPQKADAEYFLFTSHTGICSDFATAATLLARAAGLTARYTEGFALNADILGDDGLYYVTDAQAHAVSMVYLDGFGWLELDPTKYVGQSEEEEESGFTLQIIAASAVVLIALAVIFRRQLSELAFAAAYGFRRPEGRVRKLYLRTRALACRIRGIDPESVSVGEVRDILARTLSMDEQAGEICSAADRLFYGDGKVEADTKRLRKLYREIYRMKRRMKK
jgi:transglutaminase-like putative cysteine protease